MIQLAFSLFDTYLLLYWRQKKVIGAPPSEGPAFHFSLKRVKESEIKSFDKSES